MSGMALRRYTKSVIRGVPALRRMYAGYVALRYASQFEWWGFVESQLRGESVDRNGDPVPWLPPTVQAFLAARVKPEVSVFEFGSGNSTLWWSARVRRVVTCEHDAAFQQRLRALCPTNVECIAVPADDQGLYERAITRKGEHYSIVVIDGTRRAQCARTCLPALAADGVIVFDNTDVPENASAVNGLVAQGFRRLDIEGLAALVTWSNRTTILYRDLNCLSL